VTARFSEMKSYNDLRKHFPRDIFQQVMQYIAWQNRLSMTAIVTLSQALSLAQLLESHPEKMIDEFQYAVIKETLLAHPNIELRTEQIAHLSESLKTALHW
jgi:hypothetical protein